MPRAFTVLRSAVVLLLMGLALAAEDPWTAQRFERDGKALLYRQMAPEQIQDGKRYPLVVFLHGAGERGDDNLKQLTWCAKDFAKPENRARFPAFVIAPQCPARKRWVEVDWSAPAPHQTPKEPSEPMGLLLALLDQRLGELPIDRSRIYVCGLSMGGFGTWDALARRPDLFAAAIPICGGADDGTAPAIAGIPVWVWHGADDGVVKTVRSRSMVEALKKAGGSPRYTEIPKCGHGSWGPAFADPDLLPWLFAQARPAAAAAAATAAGSR